MKANKSQFLLRTCTVTLSVTQGFPPQVPCEGMKTGCRYAPVMFCFSTYIGLKPTVLNLRKMSENLLK